MLETHIIDENKPTNNSFTEIFHFLKQYKISGDPETRCSPGELSKIMALCDNAITGVLHGLQSFANYVANSALDIKQGIVHLSNFYSVMTNLIEALHDLRNDCEFLLTQRVVA